MTDLASLQERLAKVEEMRELLQKRARISHDGSATIGDRLTAVARLAADQQNGYFNDQATSGYRLSIDLFLLLNPSFMPGAELDILSSAADLLMGPNGDITTGLKADANFIEYLKAPHRRDPQRVARDNATALLLGHSALFAGTQPDGSPIFRQIPRFLPDASGLSDTDEIIIHTGFPGHATYTKISKVGYRKNYGHGPDTPTTESPDYYRFFLTEYNAGAESHGTTVIHTREIVAPREKRVDRTDPSQATAYISSMQEVLTNLLVALRMKKIHRDNGTYRDAIEGCLIDCRAGHAMSHAGELQQSGNCTLMSQKLVLFHYLAKKTNPVVAQRMIEDHWRFMQRTDLSQAEMLLAAEKARLQQEIAELEAAAVPSYPQPQSPLTWDYSSCSEDTAEYQHCSSLEEYLRKHGITEAELRLTPQDYEEIEYNCWSNFEYYTLRRRPHIIELIAAKASSTSPAPTELSLDTLFVLLDSEDVARHIDYGPAKDIIRSALRRHNDVFTPENVLNVLNGDLDYGLFDTDFETDHSYPLQVMNAIKSILSSRGFTVERVAAPSWAYAGGYY